MKNFPLLFRFSSASLPLLFRFSSASLLFCWLLLVLVGGCGGGSSTTAANVPSGNPEPQPPVQQPSNQPDPEPVVQEPDPTPDPEPVVQQPVNQPDNTPDNQPEEELLTQRQGIVEEEEEEPDTLPATEGDSGTQTYDLLPLSSYDYGDGMSWDQLADNLVIGIRGGFTSPDTDILGTRHGWAGRKYTKWLLEGSVVESNYETHLYVDSMVNASYSYYGYWLAKDSEQNVIITRPFYAYGGDKDLPNSNDLSNLTTGSATYTGDAVGMYDVRGSNPQSGHFNAEVSLTANFATDKIKGTINNFNGPTGMWSIELTETDFTNDGAITNTRTIWTMDGVAGAENGSWKGQMLGTSSGHPQDIVGGFYAEHTNAFISGAFGVEKE